MKVGTKELSHKLFISVDSNQLFAIVFNKLAMFIILLTNLFDVMNLEVKYYLSNQSFIVLCHWL